MAPKNRERCCAYLRRSREDIEAEQSRKFETLAKHKRLLEFLANENGHEISEWYQEIVSGETIEGRPEMKRLLHDVVLGKWDCIYVVEASRLGRGSGSDQDKIINTIRVSGVTLLTDTKSYDPKSSADMKLLRSELRGAQDELEANNARLQRGVMLAVQEGCYMGVRPYGWEKVRVNRKWTLAPHPEQNARMLLIFDLLDEQDFSVFQVKKYFEAMKWPNPSGGEEWSKEAIRGIATNILNAGFVTWGKNKTSWEIDPETLEARKVIHRSKDFLVVQGLHMGAGTVPLDKFKRVQEKLRRNAPSHHDEPMQNPLSGIMVCGKCGYAMKRRTSKRRRYKASQNGGMYTRFDHSDDHRACGCKGAPAEQVMDVLMGSLRNIYRGLELSLTDEGKRRERERREKRVMLLEGELSNAKAARERILHAYETGRYTDEDFDRRIKMADEGIAGLMAAIDEERGGIPDEWDVAAQMAAVASVMETLEDDTVSAAEKNSMLKGLVERIDYYNDAPPRVRANQIRLDIFLA